MNNQKQPQSVMCYATILRARNDIDEPSSSVHEQLVFRTLKEIEQTVPYLTVTNLVAQTMAEAKPNEFLWKYDILVINPMVPYEGPIRPLVTVIESKKTRSAFILRANLPIGDNPPEKVDHQEFAHVYDTIILTGRGFSNISKYQPTQMFLTSCNVDDMSFSLTVPGYEALISKE